MQNLKFKVQNFMMLLGTVTALLIVSPVSAHVSVKPAEVGVGKYQTFNVSVPVEKDVATTGVRLIIPAGLEHVSPNVKPGWDVEIKKAGTSMKGSILNTGAPAPDPESVIEIIWTGGLIPKGMRDDFYFSAKAPVETGALKWMAYQIYADGTEVAWDLDSGSTTKTADGKEDFSTSGPYSVTEVVNDLAASPKAEMNIEKGESLNNLPLILSVLAVVVSGFALGLTLRRR